MTPAQSALLEEIFGTKKNMLYPDGALLSQTFDLSVAQTGLRLDFAGDFIYADRNTTGYVNLIFNGFSMSSFPFGQNTAINNFPYKALYLSWPAQTGKLLTLWYGYGANIVPPNQDISSILNTVNVNAVGLTYATSYSSSALITAGTPLNIISAASNILGYTLWNTISQSGTAGGSVESWLAKATAPVALFDGDALNWTDIYTVVGANIVCSGRMLTPLKVIAGKRLDAMVSVTQTFANRTCLYTLT